MESMINRWEIEREDALTAKVQKLNQKVHCRARGRHASCLSRAIAMRRRRHTVSKNYFILLLTLLVCLFLRHRGCARQQKKFQRSSEHHERFAELDIVHNQASTNSPPPSTPPPQLGALPLLPPAPAARTPPVPQLRPKKKSKDHCTGQSFP
jgi:hypothetical protein